MPTHLAGGLQGSLTDRAKYRIYETREEYKQINGVDPPPYDETRYVKNWFIPESELVGPLAPVGSQRVCMIPDVLACTTDGTPRIDAKTGKPYTESIFMAATEVVAVNIMENRSAEMDPAKMKPDPKVIGTWPAPIIPPGPDEEWVVMFGGVVDIRKKSDTPAPVSGSSGTSQAVMDELTALRRGQDNIAAKLDLLLAVR